VSSLAAGGPAPCETARTERDGAQPVSAYGRMKLACEEAARAQAARVPVTIVRPPMVIGEGDRWALGLFTSAQKGLHVVPSRAPSRVCLIHAADLAPVLVRAVERGARAGVAPDAEHTGVYYAAADDRPLYAELGAWVAAAMGVAPPRVLRLPSALSWAAAAVSEAVARVRDRQTILNLDKWREATAGSWLCDAARARAELGLACAPTSERLAETAAAYRAVGWL
jgi:nucleoside-diphosphate-sugar epimerase